MQGFRVRNEVPDKPPAFGIVGGSGKPAAPHTLVIQALGRGNPQILALGVNQRDRCGGEHSSQYGGLAHQFEQLRTRLDANDRLIGRAEGFEHSGEPLLLLFGPCLFVGAIEIFQREGDVLRQAAQQLDQFGRERAPFHRVEDDHTLRAIAVEQRQRGGRVYAAAASPLVPWPGSFIGLEIVADAGLPSPECGPGQSAPFRHRIRDREFQAAHLVGVRPVGGDNALEFGTRLGQRDGRGAELCATHRGCADQVEELAARLRPHDRFVGRAERREHACQPLSLVVGFRLFLRAIEIVERERDILRHARHQRDDLFIRGPEFADEEHPHADALAGLDERKRDAGHDAGLASNLLPWPALHRVEDIGVDARLLRAECIAAYAGAVDIVRIGRESRLRDQFDDITGSGDRFQPDRVRLGEQNHRGEGFSAVNRGVADQLVELLRRLGAEDGLIGRADGAEHAIQSPHRPFAGLPRSLMIEIVERIGRCWPTCAEAAKRSGRSANRRRAG